MHIFNRLLRKKREWNGLILLVIFVSLVIPAFSQTEPAPAAPGEKTISLTLTDTPLSQIVSIISDTFGIGVIPSKGAQGNVTVALTNATLEQALDGITQPNGWVWVRKDNIITIYTKAEWDEVQKGNVITKTFYILNTNAQDVQNVVQPLLSTAGKIIRDDRTNQLQVTDTPESIARIETVIQSLDVPISVEVFKLKYAVAADVKQQLDKVKTAKGDIQVDERTNSLIVTDVPSAIDKMRTMIESLDSETQLEVFDINYAKPKDIQAAIKDLVTKRGYIQIDDRNDKIIVDDIPSHLEKIAKVIKAMDQPDRIVYIEAEIVDMDYNKSLTLGINWSYGASWTLSNSSSGSVNIPIGSNWFQSVKNFFSGYSSSLGLTATASAQALSQLNANSELLASPRIMAKNDEKASVVVGGTIPYSVLYTQPVTGTTGTSYQQYYSQASQPYGITLEVTPHINADGMIDIKLKLENTQATAETLNQGTGNSFTGVATVTERAETMVQIHNNETVVIGGMVEKTKNDSGTGIPVLEDIPLIGPVIFGQHTKQSDKRNLVLFLTPHLVSGNKSDFEKLYPEAYTSYSYATSGETDKERAARLKKELKEKQLQQSQITPPPLEGTPVTPDTTFVQPSSIQQMPPDQSQLLTPQPAPMQGNPITFTSETANIAQPSSSLPQPSSIFPHSPPAQGQSLTPQPPPPDLTNPSTN